MSFFINYYVNYCINLEIKSESEIAFERKQTEGNRKNKAALVVNNKKLQSILQDNVNLYFIQMFRLQLFLLQHDFLKS